MDLEAAVIRAEMSQTRLALDSKIEQLEEKVRDMTPRRYWERHRPDYLLDRTIGGVLMIAGLALAWSQYKKTPRSSRAVSYTNEEGPAYWGT